MKKVKVSQFRIKSRRTGSQLRGHENELVFEVFTADGSKKVKGGFGSRRAAERWLSETVKIANIILARKEE